MNLASDVRPKHWIILILLSLTWGSSFVAIATARDAFSPLSIAFCRIAIGAVILVIFAASRGSRLPTLATKEARRFWLFALLLGLFSNALPFTLISWAQAYVSSSFAGLTMATVPLVVLPLAHIFIPSEKLSAKKIIGFAIGFIGTVVLIDPFEDGLWRIGAPEWALILSAASYATGSILTRFSPQGTPTRMAAGILVAGALLMLPIVLATHAIPTSWPILPTLALVHLGLFSTGVAAIFIVITIKEVGPSFLSLSNYLVPIWAMIFGAGLLGEAIPTRFYLALALIFAGILISRHKKTSAQMRGAGHQ